MNRLKIAQYIATGATIFLVIGFIISETTKLRIGGSMMAIGLLAGLVSYFFGGFLTSLKMAGNIAKWGWYALPFPYDLPIVMLSFIYALLVFFVFPIIPVRKAYKESMQYE